MCLIRMFPDLWFFEVLEGNIAPIRMTYKICRVSTAVSNARQFKVVFVYIIITEF